MVIFFIILCILGLGVYGQRKDPYLSLAWQEVEGELPLPEKNVPILNEKSSSAVTFSGGGARAFSAAIGFLAGLHEVRSVDDASERLLSRVRYAGGVSGGAWAVGAFTFASCEGGAANSSAPCDEDGDDILLGAIPSPSEISLKSLDEMNPACLRRLVAGDVVKTQLKHFVSTGFYNLFQSWVFAVHEVFFRPMGIPAGALLAYDSAQREATLTRNPGLRDCSSSGSSSSSSNSSSSSSSSKGRTAQNRPWLLARPGRPLPLLASTLIAPLESLPANPTTRNYSLLEVTAIAAGVISTRDVVYPSLSGSSYGGKEAGRDERNHSGVVRVGGLVEPFATGRAPPPRHGLSAGESSGLLKIPAEAFEETYPDARIVHGRESESDPRIDAMGRNGPCGGAGITLELAAGASSWNVGCEEASWGRLSSAALLSPQLRARLETHAEGWLPYWSPASANPSLARMVLGDGGGLQVENLVSFVQRAVRQVRAQLDFSACFLPAFLIACLLACLLIYLFSYWYRTSLVASTSSFAQFLFDYVIHV
jgi:hypothetical protein